MKYVYIVLNWLFGVVFLVLGAVAIFQSVLGGVALLSVALLLLPPVRAFVHSKTQWQLPVKARAIAIVALVVAFGMFMEQSKEREAKQLAEQEALEKAHAEAALEKKNIEYFNAHSAEVLGQLQGLIDQGNYKEAISTSEKYLPANSAELNELRDKAKAELTALEEAKKAAKEKAERQAKTKEILETLKTLPASQVRQNRNLYAQLVEYYPDNETYREKLEYYSAKFKAQLEQERREQEAKKKEREARIAKFGEPPTRSGWDGSYLPVKKYLERIAHDPDSIKFDGCTEVYHTDKGWLVGCDYRGRNAFGALIRQSNWFTIVRGRVVEMHEASAYKP